MFYITYILAAAAPDFYIGKYTHAWKKDIYTLRWSLFHSKLLYLQ